MHNVNFEGGGTTFILFIFPLIGLFLEHNTAHSRIYWTLGISALLLIPIFTPWHYIIPYAYPILLLILLAAGYAVFLQMSDNQRVKTVMSVVITVMLFLILGFQNVVSSFAAGSNKRIVKKWTFKNYNVEYTVDQGFAGHALIGYELSQHKFIFSRHIESAMGKDTTTNCMIQFPVHKIRFDKCNGSLETFR